MTTTRLQILLVLCLAPLGLGSSACQDQRPKRPNILFVFADDHAYQAIGAYGSRINQTPNLDRLARGGMRFERCLVTNSICAPSRAVILTGKYSHLNGVLDNRSAFDGSQETFPKLLQQAGYQTALVGKWHLKSDPTGFDHWMVLPGQGSYYNPELRSAEGSVQIEGYVTDVITDLTLDWLKQGRDPDRPFLLMYQHKAPHRSWMPGPKHLSDFRSQTIPEPETLFDDYSRRASPAANQSMEIGRHAILGYDLKLPPSDGDSSTAQDRARWERSFGRLTSEFRRNLNASWRISGSNSALSSRHRAPRGAELELHSQTWLRSPGRSISVEPGSTNGGLETTATTLAGKVEFDSTSSEPLGSEAKGRPQ